MSSEPPMTSRERVERWLGISNEEQVYEPELIDISQSSDEENSSLPSTIPSLPPIEALLPHLFQPPAQEVEMISIDGDDDDDVCPICLGHFEQFEVIECGHKFHTQCLNAWKQTGKDTCPVCRKCLT